MDFSNLSDEELEALIARKQQNEAPKRNMPLNEGGALSFGRGALDAATFGTFPKIAGYIGSLLRPEFSYEELRDTMREQNAAAAEANPYSNFAGNIAGSAFLPFPAKSIGSAAKLGALYGGAYGLGSSDAGETGTINAEDVANAAASAALGGVTAGAGYGLLNKLLGKKNPPNQEVVDRLSLSEKFDIPLTRGEALNDPTVFLQEEAALQGRLGNKNQKDITDFNTNRLAKYKQEVADLRSNIGGNNEYIEKGGNISNAIENIKDKAMAQREQYSKLYQEATEGITKINTDDFNLFQQNVAKDLADSILTPDNVPTTYGELNSLKNIIDKNAGSEIDFKQLEAWRQGLNRSYRSSMKTGNEQEAYALSQVKNKFDGFMDGVIENTLKEGDFNALKKFKEARGLASEWHKKYTAKNPTEYGKKFLQDIIDNKRLSDTPYTNEQIVNKIFGTSELGFKPEAAAIIKELKGALNPKEFFDIKIEAGHKLLAPLLKDTPNVTTYNNNLRKFLHGNPTLTKTLFDKKEIKDLIDIGELGKTMFTRQKSTINPSGTAQVILDSLKKNKYTQFIGNLFDRVQLDQNKIKTEALRGSKENITMPYVGAANPLIAETSTQNQTQQLESPIEPPTGGASPTGGLQTLSDAELENLINQKQSTGNNTNSVLDKIAYVESSNNPNAKNPSSTASGLFQITDGTWKKLSEKYNLSGDKNNVANQRKAASLLLEENTKILQNNLDRNPTDKELYLAHFFGPNKALKAIQNKDSKVLAARLFPIEAKANRNIFFKNGKPRTMSEVYSVLTSKI